MMPYLLFTTALRSGILQRNSEFHSQHWSDDSEIHSQATLKIPLLLRKMRKPYSMEQGPTLTSCVRQSFPIVFLLFFFRMFGWTDLESDNCITLRRVQTTFLPKIRFICFEVFFKNWSEPNWIYFPFMWTELSSALVLKSTWEIIIT